MNIKDREETKGQVISFTKAREAKIEEKRRKYERILFRHLLGVYCVADNESLRAIELVDVSSEGLSFQLPENAKHVGIFEAGSEFVFRLYFSQETFLPINVRVQNKRNCIENGERYIRFGCSVDTSCQSYDTFKVFVNFLTKYAETSQQDKGDLKFYFF